MLVMLANIVQATGSKVVAMIATLLTVPLLLHSLNISDYALWTVLTGITVWFGLLDLGIGNGVRNAITESLAQGSIGAAKGIVVGSIQFFSFLVVGIVFCGSAIIPFFFSDRHLVALIFLIYGPLLLSFPLTVFNSVLQGAHLVGQQSLIATTRHVLWLIFLVIGQLFLAKLGLVILGAVYAILWLVPLIFAAIRSQRVIKLSLIDLFNLDYMGSIISAIKIGLKFFVIQLSSIVLYATGSFILYNYLAPVSVANFDAINRMFSTVVIFHGAIIGVAWTEISHGFATRDLIKIRQIRFFLGVVFVVFAVIAIMLSIFAPEIISAWTHKLSIGRWDAIPFLIATLLQVWSANIAVFFNAINALRLQMIVSILSAVLFIPIVLLCIIGGAGVASVPTGISIVLLPMCILYRFFLNREIAAKLIKRLQ